MSTGRNEESHGDVCIVKTISNLVWKEEAQANLYHELFTSAEIQSATNEQMIHSGAADGRSVFLP